MKDVHQPPKSSVWIKLDKQLYVLIVCFFISIVFWLLLALSNSYDSQISFPVKYLNMPGKKVVMNELPSQITVNFKTTGFKILAFGLKKERKPLEINVAERFVNTQINADFFSLPTGFFLPDFARELGKDVSIVRFIPDSIVFNFSDIVMRRVPVNFLYRIDFEKQYDSTGRAQVNPSTVEISGPPSIVQKIGSVNTESIFLTDVKAPVKKRVRLISNHLVSYSADEVEFTMPVEKFTEEIEEIEVHPINVQPGYSLKTFPDKVKVRFLVSLSNYNKVDASMFDAVVEADETDMKKRSKLEVRLISSPTFIRITRLEPEKVDYILRKQ